VRKKGKFSVKNNAKKLDFLYDWERATVQEQLWVWLKFTRMAKMYADCFCGIVRWKSHLRWKWSTDFFLPIDMSLYRHKKIIFGGCAKFHSLLFLNPIWPPTPLEIINRPITLKVFVIKT